MGNHFLKDEEWEEVRLTIELENADPENYRIFKKKSCIPVPQLQELDGLKWKQEYMGMHGVSRGVFLGNVDTSIIRAVSSHGRVENVNKDSLLTVWRNNKLIWKAK